VGIPATLNAATKWLFYAATLVLVPQLINTPERFKKLMWMLFTIFRVARETYAAAGEDPFKRAVSLGLLAGFMGLLLLSAAASVFIVIRIMEPFWFLVAIVATLPELKEEEEAVPAL